MLKRFIAYYRPHRTMFILDMLASLLISVIGMIVVRQLFLWLTMPQFRAIELLYYCYPVGWISTVVLLVGYYFYKRKGCVGLAESGSGAADR